MYFCSVAIFSFCTLICLSNSPVSTLLKPAASFASSVANSPDPQRLSIEPPGFSTAISHDNAKSGAPEAPATSSRRASFQALNCGGVGRSFALTTPASLRLRVIAA